MHNRLSAAREKDTYIVKYSALDQLKKGITPTTLTWSLMNLLGAAVNSRTDEVLTPGVDNWVVLTGDDLALDVDGLLVRRILLFKATYSTTVGGVIYNNLPIYIENRFDIHPVEGI